MNKTLSKYVEPNLSDARVARLWDGVRDRLRDRSSRRGRWLRLGAAAGTLAALALVALVLFKERAGAPSAWQNAALQTAGDTLSVSLHDGSELELGAETRLEVAEKSEYSVQLKLERGRVLCDVVPEPKRRFVVVAGSVRVQVTGTRFSVDLDPETQRVEVQVDRGSVEVTSRHEPGRSKRLGAGERWSVDLRAHDAPAQQTAATEAPDAPVPTGDTPETRPSTPPGAAPERTPEPASARELLDQANSARRVGDMAGAARAYEQLLTTYPNDGRAGLAAFELGRLRMDRLGNLSGAVQALKRAISLAPGSGFREDAMARLVQAYEAMGDRERCRQARDAYLKSYPSGVHTAKVTGQCGLR